MYLPHKIYLVRLIYFAEICSVFAVSNVCQRLSDVLTKIPSYIGLSAVDSNFPGVGSIQIVLAAAAAEDNVLEFLAVCSSSS